MLKYESALHVTLISKVRSLMNDHIQDLVPIHQSATLIMFK